VDTVPPVILDTRQGAITVEDSRIADRKTARYAFGIRQSPRVDQPTVAAPTIVAPAAAPFRAHGRLRSQLVLIAIIVMAAIAGAISPLVLSLIGR